MNTIVRLVMITIALVLMLAIGSGIGTQWVRKQDERLRAEVLTARRHQFGQVLRALHLDSQPWNDETKQILAEAVGATAIAELPDGVQADVPTGAWSFIYTASPQQSSLRSVKVDIAPPTSLRLLSHYQRAAVMLVLLSLTLLLLLGLALVFAARRQQYLPAESAEPLDRRAAGLKSLTRLARVSVEQGEALERERNERLRIQEDLNFQQMLLNRALEEKIRLGHDLHDGIIQALYATGLTLEAAKTSVPGNPALAEKQLEMALQTLNITIRDVRSYILGLSPEELKHRTFTESVRSVVETLGMGRGASFDLKIDSEAAAQLSENTAADLLQIVRECVSNGIRHGRASEITIKLQKDSGEFCLLVQDNGIGFDPEHARRGNGLSNIEARAERLGAQLRVTSRSGNGTRVTVTLAPKPVLK